jgi:hypothetical protein
MVNALKYLFELIEKKNLRPMKKWSTRVVRKLGTNIIQDSVKSLINQIKKILQILSGNDVVSMLKGYKLFILFLNQLLLTISLLDILTKKEMIELMHIKFKKFFDELVII